MAVASDGLATALVFDRWTLHGDGRLTGEGADIQLPPKEGQVLRLLLASGGALMTKDRLLEQAWPRGEVAEESLTRCIYALRKHLKADKGFIKTIYGRGYRFTCAVQAEEPRVCSVCGQARNG
ncbi:MULTISPECIES: winged helix-turn-helix domain-containing protein [unclassified Pseudomonas]|jgi:DNA-binding winged helix-turn-helix (wHTH) protein|uniref:winged helix-turn-helix domain-containing protein n=1 Tax=unclassified Pseudomonas TaxID=196821 RepID=UPI000EB81F5B|nr:MULTISPECIES: winged helix-turn-helix domain-containing protein [unclassified Pseudomonas]MCS4248695.1 DNA-binding winged helix-turn-helix (wHTH) protein [Pseudomonas sp. BIGb0164]NWE22655.1 winged helix-turn-helix domain-containing protein [Pseudomonas sp. P7548]HCT06023.1 transcriptional regulator [Pseudomonas sp.]